MALYSDRYAMQVVNNDLIITYLILYLYFHSESVFGKHRDVA